MAAYLESKSFYGMDEDTRAPIVANRYMKQTKNRDRVKAAHGKHGDPEAVEAGGKHTSQGFSDVEEEEGEAEGEESEVEEKESVDEDSGGESGGTREANDRWYFGDIVKDNGNRVLTLFHETASKTWDYENAPVCVASIQSTLGTGEFKIHLSLVSNIDARFTLHSANWDPQDDNSFTSIPLWRLCFPRA